MIEFQNAEHLPFSIYPVFGNKNGYDSFPIIGYTYTLHIPRNGNSFFLSPLDYLVSESSLLDNSDAESIEDAPIPFFTDWKEALSEASKEYKRLMEED